jgi:catechol 2,3-dioxygenase-like lactoylglutathione lyase family enzyme
MITGIGSVAVLVNDAQRSAEWYRDKLGFEIVQAEGHTVFVKPKGSQLLLHLCGKCGAWETDSPGGRTGVWLQCGEVGMRKDKKSGRLIPASDPDDVERTYLELKKKGVEFSETLTSTSWGRYAILKDPDGNEFEMS